MPKKGWLFQQENQKPLHLHHPAQEKEVNGIIRCYMGDTLRINKFIIKESQIKYEEKIKLL